MGFAQLYYTSCESGLSDFAGFQFNAATPGLPPEVLREVEALTSYEPPRSLGYRPSAAEIAACPVNLVYRCEPRTVLANVVFVGLDFSQRLGNYFAHALVGQTGTDRFDRVLPIELWGSPVWAGEPVAHRELPVLTALPDPAAVPEPAALPDPADLSDPREPADPSEPADPPGRTGPPAGCRISRACVDRFLAVNDRPDELMTLVSAAETAVLRQGRSIVIIEADTAAAAHWIAAISFLLAPSVARRMSFATYQHRPEYSGAHVVATLPESDFDLGDSTFHSYVVFETTSGRISEVAPDPAAALLVRVGAGGATGLWERAAGLVEGTARLAEGYPVLVAAAVLGRLPVSAGDLDALSGWLESNPGALRPADRRALLPELLEHPAVAPHHLRSLGDLAADAAGPALEPGTGQVTGAAAVQTSVQAQLRAGGERVLGPALVQAGGGAALEGLTGSAALLEGALAHLVAVMAEDPDAVIDVFAGGLGELIDDELALPLPLRRAALLARCRRDLLEPTGRNGPGSDWLVRAITEPARDRAYLRAYLTLCRAIEDGTVTAPLPGTAQVAVSSFLATVRELEQARAEPDEAKALSLRRLAGSYPQQRPTVQDLLREALPGQIDELAGSGHLPGAVTSCPGAVVAAYLETARQRLAGTPADVPAAALLFETLQTLRAGHDAAIAPSLDDTLRRGLRDWSPEGLDQLRERLRSNDPGLAAGFTEWRGQHLGGVLSRSLSRLARRRTGP